MSEVDLATLQVTAYEQYPQPISVISEAFGPTPLTVGTSHSLHIHDPRIGPRSRRLSTGIKEHMQQQDDFHRIHTGDAHHAILTQPIPLSIVHTGSNMIHVAGRFPSIVVYERRFFARVDHSIYSCARLICIAPFSSMHGATLAAVGDYKGKGSLELYPLDSPLQPGGLGTVQNRTSASRSKCLSVASQGARLLISAGDGLLKWVERDGSTLVRRWNINSYSSTPNGVSPSNIPMSGIFSNQVDEGEVVQKIITTNARANSDICLWTGEKIGVLHFGHERNVDAQRQNTVDEIENDAGSSEVTDREAQQYGSGMRQALERQANLKGF